MVDLKNASKVLDGVELAFNAVALAVCWAISFRLLHYGEAAWNAVPPLPSDAGSALAWVVAPGLEDRALSLLTAPASLTVAAVLAFSAAEGSWWLLRRLVR